METIFEPLIEMSQNSNFPTASCRLFDYSEKRCFKLEQQLKNCQINFIKNYHGNNI